MLRLKFRAIRRLAPLIQGGLITWWGLPLYSAVAEPAKLPVEALRLWKGGWVNYEKRPQNAKISSA